MDFIIKVDCEDCEGQGTFTWGNPINPSTKINRCRECDGTGEIEHSRETFDSYADAQNDYPDAISIKVMS